MIENKHSVLILPHLRLIHLLYILHSPSLCSDTPKYSNISFLVIMRCKFFKVKIENHFLMEFLYTSNNTYMIQTFGIPFTLSLPTPFPTPLLWCCGGPTIHEQAPHLWAPAKNSYRPLQGYKEKKFKTRNFPIIVVYCSFDCLRHCILFCLFCSSVF